MSSMKKPIRWNAEKAKLVSKDATRGNIGFHNCVIAIEEGRVLDDIPHPKKKNQRLLILDIESYAYVVPYVLEEDGGVFFKTVFPSRKHTNLYLK